MLILSFYSQVNMNDIPWVESLTGDDWDKPQYYLQDVSLYAYSYVCVVIFMLTMAPMVAGNSVHDNKSYQYVGFVWSLGMLGMCLAMRQNVFDAFNSGATFWVLTFISCILMTIEWLRILTHRHHGPHVLLKQKWYEAYVRNLLMKPVPEEQDETSSEVAAIEDNEEKNEEEWDGSFNLVEEHADPSAYITWAKGKGYNWKCILEDFGSLWERRMAPERATEPYHFNGNYKYDDRGFMRVCIDAVIPRATDKVKNPYTSSSNHIPIPGILVASFLLTFIWLICMTIEGYYIASDLRTYVTTEEPSRIDAEAAAAYDKFGCPVSNSSTSCTIPRLSSEETIPIACVSLEALCAILLNATQSLTTIAEEQIASAEQSRVLGQSLYDSQEFANTFALLMSFSVPSMVFIGYKKKLLELRQQHCTGYYLSHVESSYKVYTVAYFPGCVISFCIIGYCLIDVCLLLIYFCLDYAPLREPVLEFCWDWGLAYIMLYLFNTVLIKDVLFSTYVTDVEHPECISSPRLYDFVYNIILLFELPLQLLACAYRVLYALCFAIFSLFRIDLSMMPRGMESFDSGFSSFAAMLLLNERQNSPCVLVFLDSISMVVSDTPQPHPKATAKPTEDAGKWQKLHAERTELLTAIADKRDQVPDVIDIELSDKEIKGLKRIRVARNRWTLALTLLKNPEIRKFRKHRLFVPEEEEEDEEEDEEKKGYCGCLGSSQTEMADGVELDAQAGSSVRPASKTTLHVASEENQIFDPEKKHVSTDTVIPV